jgi:hypothetical protein
MARCAKDSKRKRWSLGGKRQRIKRQVQQALTGGDGVGESEVVGTGETLAMLEDQGGGLDELQSENGVLNRGTDFEFLGQVAPGHRCQIIELQ